MSCFGGGEEQIYLAEITVERLRLTAEKYKEEFANDPPLVKIKFLEFPVFVIGRRPRDTCAAFPTTEPYDENVGLIYASGKSCLFVMKPTALVRSMQIRPLAIGVFRGEETYPIAEGTVALAGCLCDQIAMVKNDANHRPEPYELYGNYVVCDPGKTPAGNIRIFFRLTLFGDYIISHYQLYENSAIFKNDFDGEMRVMKVVDEDDEEDYEDGYEEEQEARSSFKLSGHTPLATMKSGIEKSEKIKNNLDYYDS